MGDLIVRKVGRLENFLKISKQGDAYLVHQSNAPNIYNKYVPRLNFEIKRNNDVYLFQFFEHLQIMPIFALKFG